MSTHSADVAIVGGGIIGLAHAYTAAIQGRKVVLFERNERAAGASIRNFGLIWPIGQPAGPMLEMALNSRRTWQQVLEQAGVPHFPTGSLHVAHRPDEADVAKEFAELAPAHGYCCQWMEPQQVLKLSPHIVKENLQGALHSNTELTVDPRLAVAGITTWLQEKHNVQLRYGHAVRSIELPKVVTAEEAWEVDQIIICCGDDFETLYPRAFKDSAITRCKLQMLRTNPQPEGWSLGPALAGGLTLRFYHSFRICSTLAKLQARITEEMPFYEKWGIHVMVSQTPARELTLGDSHQYGMHVDIFNDASVDEAITSYLQTFFRPPVQSIAQRWYGVYSKHPTNPYFYTQPQPGVHIVTALGGAGMTLSFGLASETLRNIT